MQLNNTHSLFSKKNIALAVLLAIVFSSCTMSKDYITVQTYDGKKEKYYTENPNHPWQYTQPNPFTSCKIPSVAKRMEKKNIPSLVATSN
jgi:hypothetical protein